MTPKEAVTRSAAFGGWPRVFVPNLEAAAEEIRQIEDITDLDVVPCIHEGQPPMLTVSGIMEGDMDFHVTLILHP